MYCRKVVSLCQSTHNAWLLPPNRLSYPLAMVCHPERPRALYVRGSSGNNTPPKRQPHGMNSAITRRTITSFAILSFACTGLRAAQGANTAIQYNRDVRPILFENCFSCHGPDSASRQAELRLDKREVAIDRKAIVPGNPDASEMIRRILSDDANEQMPPPVTKKKLSHAQKKLLVEWIKSGAEYQPHWSLIAPVRPPVPTVAGVSDPGHNWARNPIDNFVAAKLKSVGLMPALEADRRTLARRVSLDLIGLPPSPELVEAFVKDD